MSRYRHFLHTAEVTGMGLGEGLRALLGGREGPPVPLKEILRDFEDDREALRMASSALETTGDLRLVADALAGRGIHPLSLLMGGDPALRRQLLTDGPGLERLHRPAYLTECSLFWGNLYLQRFHAPHWLRRLPPSLRFVSTLEMETLVLSDSDISGLFHPGRLLESHLKILACEGRARFPEKGSGRLQLHFSDARFHFPKSMHLEGILEIRGCPGVDRLPSHLRTEGLYLDHCPNLRELPHHLKGARQVELVALPVGTLPETMEGLTYLRLVRLPELEQLRLRPDPGLEVELHFLERLRHLEWDPGPPLRDLTVTHCPDLESLDGLTSVSGSLSLRHLPGLTRLPEGLAVGTYLQIIDCPNLGCLPEGLTVGGDLQIEGCPGLGAA